MKYPRAMVARMCGTRPAWALACTSLVFAGALCACSGSEEEGAPASRERPNIVLIFADDLGFADLGIHGSRDIQTPNIDRLGRQGARFANGYVSAPQCTPARAGILTGRAQNRFGVEMNAAADYSVSEAERLAGKPLAGLPLSELTIADRLRSAGYATGVIGKWHLGEEEAFHPSKRGFDEFYGFLGGGSRYLPAKRTPVLERGGVREVCKEYLTDAFSDEAVAFIDRHSEEPFFLYLSYNCPHTPMEAKPEDLARFKSIADPTRRALAGMMYAMDRGVGRVMDKLESAGLEEDTLVLFISDNGGQTTKNASLNTPFAGKKGDLLEGGIRVPFFARWTGRIPADLVLDDAVTSLDVCSTAVSLAGLPVAPELDGLDLSRYLCGQVDALPARVLCWRFGEQRAIRRGDWKYYSYMDDISLLFDLSTDPGERRNLIGAHPGIAEELQGLHSQWELGMVEPLWDTPMNHSLRLRALGRRYGINAASPK